MNDKWNVVNLRYFYSRKEKSKKTKILILMIIMKNKKKRNGTKRRNSWGKKEETSQEDNKSQYQYITMLSQKVEEHYMSKSENDIKSDLKQEIEKK